MKLWHTVKYVRRHGLKLEMPHVDYWDTNKNFNKIMFARFVRKTQR